MQEPTRPDFGEGRSGGNRMSEQIPSDLPGYWRRHADKRGPCLTREVPAVIAVRINWQLVRDRPGWLGWRRGSQYPTKPGNSGGGKGPQLSFGGVSLVGRIFFASKNLKDD